MNPIDTDILIHQNPNSKSETTPSYVWKNPRTKEVIVGIKALASIGIAPPPIGSIMRLMGQKTPVRLTDEDVTPEKLASYILREMKRQIEEDVARFSDEDTVYVVDRAIVTIPAYFDLPRIEATRKAGEMAGLEVLELLHEPTASACYHCWKHNIQNGIFLVYDLGGGTFDVTVLRCTAGAFEVLAINGNIWLGGDNLDAALADVLLQRLKGEGYSLDLDLKNSEADRLRFDKLRFLAEGVKKALSSAGEYLLCDTASMQDKDGQVVAISTSFDRVEFEALIKPIVNQTIPICFDALEQAERQAGVKLSDIDEIILVGGPTHIPLVREIVRQNLCSPISVNQAEVADPRAMQPRAKCTEPLFEKVDTIVALGAAIRASATGGLIFYTPDKSVRLSFKGMGITNSKETYLGGKVEARVDPVSPYGSDTSFLGGTVRLSIPSMNFKEDTELQESGVFHFRQIPLQQSVENTLQFEVLDKRGNLRATFTRQVMQTQDVVGPTFSAGTAKLPKPIFLEVTREGKPYLKEIVPELASLPYNANFTITHPGDTELLRLPLYQAKRKIGELDVVVPVSLQKGVPIDFSISVDAQAFITVKGQVGDQVFEAVVNQPPDREIPSDEAIGALDASFSEVLPYLAAGKRAVFEAKYATAKSNFEDAVRSGEKERAVTCFEDMEAIVAEYGQSSGPLQPPKDSFDKTVQTCYRLNEYVKQEAVSHGVEYSQEQIAKAIDAQRSQGEAAFEANDQDGYSEAISMLQNIQEYIKEEGRKFIKVPTETPREKAARYVRQLNEDALEVRQVAVARKNPPFIDEIDAITRKLPQLKIKIAVNPEAVIEEASTILQHLAEIKDEAFETLNNSCSQLESLAANDGPRFLGEYANRRSRVESPQRNFAETNNYSHDYSVVKTSEVPGSIIDKVHFSVTSPSQVRQNTSFVVDIWAHLEKQRDEIIRRAQEALPSTQICVKSKGPVNVVRGTVLTIRLKIDGLIVENYEDTILWVNEIGNANFNVNVPKGTSKGSKTGIATIHANGFQIARIYFTIQVGEETSQTNIIPAQEQQHRKAFASYATADRDQVLACIQGIQKVAPQLEVFMDILSLRSGQYWERELWKIIPSNDVFYLFWSHNASESQWVEKEWRCALETRGLDFIDPVPLETPEEVPPPPELASKHFNDWVLAYKRRQQQ